MLIPWGMSRQCLKCRLPILRCSKYGYFVRRSDKIKIPRFRCERCGFIFSQATFQSCYRQKKRRLNPRIFEMLCSGVSQRRTAKLLKLTRKTVAKKFVFLAQRAQLLNAKNFASLNPVAHLQFDDLETLHHTKCKPLSVTLAVEQATRRVLGFRVSQMPAKGHLAKISLKNMALDMTSGLRHGLSCFGNWLPRSYLPP